MQFGHVDPRLKANPDEGKAEPQTSFLYCGTHWFGQIGVDAHKYLVNVWLPGYEDESRELIIRLSFIKKSNAIKVALHAH